MYRRLVLLMVSAAALAACTAVGPDYAPPPMQVAPEWQSPADTRDIDTTWWRTLKDPMLAGLIDTALRNNFDLREAEARLRQARADRDAVRGRALPAIDAAGSATKNRLSENGQIPVNRIPGFDPTFPLYDIGFDASWEIDIWGATRRAVEGAEARVEAAEEARRSVLLSIVAEVARSYVDLRAAQARLASARNDAEAQQEVARLVGARYRAGEASRFDFARADAQAQTTTAELQSLEVDATAAAYRIGVLIGQPPEKIPETLLVRGALPQAPSVVPVGLRADLLRRRPDVRQAERELAAATADIGVATADLFPRFSLIGGVGLQARDTDDLTSGDSLRFQAGPTFHWPLFSGGRIRAQIRAADAKAEAAAARYERLVISALSESETAINRFSAAQETRRRSEAARAQSAVALDLARQRYRAGEDDLIVLLNAQSAFSLADRQSVEARAAELNALIALYKALGGGWEQGEGGA
ncbi:efflux transporter outer membrane subunit [Pedomonas mirosovicensis]|uniref:efflux transporter outer membrane subunit n=1 Tax=Pedomonas mirosovicensis TaxID=2908641 RepID=UPI00216970C7|nr:efflux transporter outer membrane subunit [Pedomonas mirosovicensis]MCH8686684.1 efflux transporter outer membrane subunit [Pedomonas mirosovicensis]